MVNSSDTVEFEDTQTQQTSSQTKSDFRETIYGSKAIFEKGLYQQSEFPVT